MRRRSKSDANTHAGDADTYAYANTGDADANTYADTIGDPASADTTAAAHAVPSADAVRVVKRSKS